MHRWVPILLGAMLFPLAYAQCPEPAQGEYPGWQERFNGSLDLGNATSFEDFNVSVTKIFGVNNIQVTILRHYSEYVKGSVTAGKNGVLKKADIMIELYNTTGNTAYLSIYTPQKANLTANVTYMRVFASEEGRTNLMPNEEFQIDFSLNNTGELGAENITITPQFGDFKILSADLKNVSYLCQDDVYNFKYTLKAPDVRKVFNYTLYLKMGYSDRNIQTNQFNRYVRYYSIEVTITPSMIEVERSSGNWTLTNPGRDVAVQVLINNTGDTEAYNVEWSADVPPYVEVVGGTTSWKGSIPANSRRWFSYKLVSDDPIICQEISQVTYEDFIGNKYTSLSNNETARFSPFISISKKIDGISFYIDPTKNVAGSATTWEIDWADWWSNGTSTSVTSSPRKIWINRTANIEVKIKNRGNAVARGLWVNETIDGLKAVGTTHWEGELKPDEEISYNYTLKVLKHGNLTLNTNASYLDVDPASFGPPVEIEGKPALRYCTTIPKRVESKSKDEFYGLYPGINISQPSKRVLSDFEFDFNITVANNASDSVYDVITQIDISSPDISSFKYGGPLIKGQPLYYQPELRAMYYPDGTNRTWAQKDVTYSLVLAAPYVENDTNFTITTTVNYTDFYGSVYSKNATTNITVLKARPAYTIVTLEKKGLSVTPGAPNEIDIGDYGEAFIKLKSTGYSALENVTFNISIPHGLEIASNDTAWTGRIEAQLRRANDTWYWFTGNISRNGSLGIKEEKNLPLLIRGTRAGLYKIPYTVTYDENQLSGSFELRVRGAILAINKSLDKHEVDVTEYINATVAVKNIGEDSAKDVIVVDYVPLNFEVYGNTKANLTELKPGEEIVLRYALKAPKTGSYSIDRATVKWADRLGNEYMKESSGLRLEVKEIKPEEEIKKPPVEEEIKLSKKQIIVTAAFILVFLWLIFKLLLLSVSKK